MDFLILLLSNLLFLYSDNAYGFLFALPEYSRMRLKLYQSPQAEFRLAGVSFFQLVFWCLALKVFPFSHIVLYIVLLVNGIIKYGFYTFHSIKTVEHGKID